MLTICSIRQAHFLPEAASNWGLVGGAILFSPPWLFWLPGSMLYYFSKICLWLPSCFMYVLPKAKFMLHPYLWGSKGLYFPFCIEFLAPDPHSQQYPTMDGGGGGCVRVSSLSSPVFTFPKHIYILAACFQDTRSLVSETLNGLWLNSISVFLSEGTC